MSVLDKLASSLNRKDEIPNQDLAKELADSENQEDIQELVDNLKNPKQAIQNDCIKVLYEIAEIKAHLIEPYVDEFADLLSSKNNRLVWGAMTALGLIVDARSKEVWKHLDVIQETTTNGSVITQDWGIRVLATLSSIDKLYEKKIFPFLLNFLETCPDKDLPRHGESYLVAIDTDNRETILNLLQSRLDSLKASG